MTISKEMLEGFKAMLTEEERSKATVTKYIHDIASFAAWLGEGELSKERTMEWKAHLAASGYVPASVNTKLSALNGFLRFLGRTDCMVRYLKVQRRLFRDREKELTKEEYEHLLQTARSLGRERLELLMETICATGIRVSEVRYITVEAVRDGRADVALKGKIRTILLPGKLSRKLRSYAKQQKIASGEIFLTKSGKPMCRTQIWAEMKAICAKAGVKPAKVFPHNLRHLFARTFYRACRDIVRLADVLGHSSVETTRIYLISTGEEYAREMERLGLVS